MRCRMRIPPSAVPLLSILIAAAAVSVGLGAAVAAAAPAVVETGPLSPAEQLAKFRLPAELEVQLVAAEPTIQKPMNMAFDGRGRLWVTHSVEYPFVAPAGAAARDGLTVLEDFGPDGLARKATRFADGLMIPIGVLPLPCVDPAGRGQEVIVWSIPHIWKLTDADGDGRADRREVLYGPFAFDDTHGNQNSFRLAADGWVYANHGFRNHSRVKLRGEGPEVLELKSGNGYRFRPDGSAIEQVSWGQVNPFGMDFDALGNRFNADCHSRPLTMLLRGGRYPSPFGIRNSDYDDGVGIAPETTSDSHGSTGICAVAICDTDRMPPAYRGSAFVGNVVTNQIHRDVIEWRGSSPWVGRPEEFLACDDWWFRPVDLAFGPDGGLYVADFYNCIIGHYEVDLKHPRRDRERGRIWRVVWRQAGPRPSLLDLPRRSPGDLVAQFDAPSELLRRLAFEQFVARGRLEPSIGAEIRMAAAGAHGRARAVRALGLLGQLDDATIEAAASDPARLVRVHLVKAIDALPGRELAHDRLLSGWLSDPDPFVRRAAAEALAARPMLEALPDLLAALRSADTEDTQLIYGLRRAIASALRSASLESLNGVAVAEANRLPLLDIVSGLPGPVAAAWGFSLARQTDPPVAVLGRVCHGVARYGDESLVEAATEFARSRCGEDIDAGAVVIQSLLDGRAAATRPITPPSGLTDWAEWLIHAVGAMPAEIRPGDGVVRAAVTAADRLAVRAAVGLVIAVLGDPSRPIDLRCEAAATAIRIDPEPAITAMLARVGDRKEPAATRVEFVRMLARFDRPQVRAAIVTALSTAPAPEQRSLTLASLADRAGGEAVITLIERGKISARLLQDPQIVRRVRDLGVADAEARIGRLTTGLPSADDHLRSLIERVSQRVAAGDGSAAAGAALFTRHCGICHRFGGIGALVGPQLDGVGLRGPSRLLEDIVDPSRNVDEAFRTTVVTLADGRVVSGLKIRDDGRTVVLVDAVGREQRVPRSEVEETTTAAISPMPTNVADQIGEEALPDLIAYLRDERPHAAGESEFPPTE